MKLAFYGDSWFWTWFDTNQDVLTNPELSKLKGIEKDKLMNGYDVLTPLLNSMGHKVLNHCHPGNSFRETVQDICETSTKSDVHIVYVSTVIRHTELEKFLNKPWNQIKVQYTEIMYQELQKLGDFALKNQQKILLFAGQTTLKSKVLQNAFKPNDPRLKYLHLGAECIVTALHNQFPPNKPIPLRAPGIFKLATWSDKTNLDNYNAETITELHKQIKYFQSEPFKIWTWPDLGHLNFNGQIHFLNLLFDKIQQYK